MRSIPRFWFLEPRSLFEPWSLFLFLYMEEWVEDARTGIFIAFARNFFITDPLPRFQMRSIPRFSFLDPRSLFGTLEHFPILTYGKMPQSC